MSRPPVYTSLNRSDFLVTEFLESELSPERDLPIYLNHYYQGYLPEGKLLYYNVEQLTRAMELEAVKSLWNSGKIQEIWDYSLVNCAILSANNIPNRYVPFTLTPRRIPYYAALCRQPKLYDVGFCGAMSPRRELVLKGLRDAGLRVLTLTNVWGEERDKRLAECECVINIHYANDYKVFERTRCEQWLSSGGLVISEESLDNDKRAVVVAYDKLVETCVSLLQKSKVLFCACKACGLQP